MIPRRDFLRTLAAAGAIVPWAKSNPPSPYYMQVLSSLAAHFGFSLETAWDALPAEVKVVT